VRIGKKLWRCVKRCDKKRLSACRAVVNPRDP
jgi:hypothetical protein